MPVDLVRLFDSDLYALSTGDEFKAAFTLWGKSFLQVPAGSVPTDDRILAHLSGAGSAWRKVKEMALRGWVLCSDGRLYHPVVAEKAKEAWQARLAQRARTEAARAARAAKRGDSDNSAPPSVTDTATRTATTSVTENVTGSKGQGQGQGQGQGIKEDPPSEGGAPRKARRLAPDWQPSPEDRGYARNLDLDPDRVAEDFRDYWHAKSGADATKQDWGATWRRWCRSDAERRTKPRQQQPASRLGWMFENEGTA